MSGEQLLINFRDFIINPAILLIFTAGFFLFVWGLVQFLLNLDQGGENEDGKKHILWGIVGMFIMASVYGILALLDNTFDLGAFSGTPDMSRYENINLPQNLFGGSQ
ncbi:MAG: hypothetical protein AAB798_00400 [Patescibacteria group bacterium]